MAALAFACGGSDKTPNDTTEVRMIPASEPAKRLHAVDAAHEIAELKCDREQRCGHIDFGAHFTSQEQCMQVQHLEAGAALSRCRDGVIETRLRNCLGEIAATDCNGVEGLERYDTCRQAVLCAM